MSQPFLHVLIPAYGRSPYLAQTLRSWESQAGSDVLVTVVDDAWPGTEIADIAREFPYAEYLRNETNLGVAANFAHCANSSQGTYSVLCGSDDEVELGYVRGMRDLAQQFPGATMLMPAVTVIDESGEPTLPLTDRVKGWLTPRSSGPLLLGGSRLVSRLVTGNWLYFPAIAWRTETLVEFGFRTDQTTVMDLDLELRMLFAGHSLAYTPQHLFRYRRHGLSLSSLEAAHGERFSEERVVSRYAAAEASRRRWRTTSILARLRTTSRLNELLQRVRVKN